MGTVKRSFCILTMFFLSTFWVTWACETLAEESAALETVPEMSEIYTGDLDGMIALNQIRVLVNYSKTFKLIVRQAKLRQKAD